MATHHQGVQLMKVTTEPVSTGASIGLGPLSSGEVTRARIESIAYSPMSDTLRNHLVTLAYVDLSTAMAEVLGHDDANWCALAVWPSLTVGATIRSGPASRSKLMLARLPMPAPMRERLVASAATEVADEAGVMNRSLAAGNRGVFYEIGLAWTDFLDTFGQGERNDSDWDEFERFGKRVMALPLPPGRVWPDGARGQLRDGFRAYLEALHTNDLARRSQLILLGNLRIGDHEQRRLQGWLDLSGLDPIRKLTRRFDDDTTKNRGIALFEQMWSRMLTKRVFFVQMNGEEIRVGKAVPPHESSDGQLFPSPLDVLDNDVAELFDRIDGASAGGDGAERWSDIDHRMAFIATLFRSRQRAGLVGVNPYSIEQRAEINELTREIDRLNGNTGFEGPLLFADMTEELDQPWSDEVDRAFRATLEEARSHGDREADDAVATFYAGSNRPPTERYYVDVLQALGRPGSAGNGPLSQFLNAPPTLPDWVDFDEVKRAQDFYADYRTAAHIGLFFGSMPLSYAASKGCQVLGLVSTLTGDTTRRFWESAKFVEDVFTSDFWEQGSEGYASIRGVRLFHAAVRSTIESDSVHIQHRPPELGGRAWNPEWGRPINQEDLLGGTIDWSVATIHVMDRFGVPLSEEHARAYFHTWQVVGWMLGVEDHLLRSPADPSRALTLEEAQYAARIIFFRQIGPTVAGRRLMDGLMSLIDDWFPKPLRRLPRSMMYAALNDDIANVLGLAPAGRPERAFIRLNAAGRTWRGNAAYRRAFTPVIRMVGNRWLTWWQQEYQEVPPYRQGGHQSVETRITTTELRLTIESYGEIEDLPVELAAIDGVDVHSFVPEDDGFESMGFTKIVEATSSVASSLRATVRQMRDGINAAQGIKRAELLIDGRAVAVSSLTDAEIDSLFPD
jgi:hypothetical protein